MTGTITVDDKYSTTTNAAANTSMDIESIATSIKDAGFGIDDMHNFQDLRGGQSDTGDEQTLVIWTANGMDLSEIGSALQGISEDMPYE